jgi:hypothetical protein
MGPRPRTQCSSPCGAGGKRRRAARRGAARRGGARRFGTGRAPAAAPALPPAPRHARPACGPARLNAPQRQRASAPAPSQARPPGGGGSYSAPCTGVKTRGSGVTGESRGRAGPGAPAELPSKSRGGRMRGRGAVGRGGGRLVNALARAQGAGGGLRAAAGGPPPPMLSLGGPGQGGGANQGLPPQSACPPSARRRERPREAAPRRARAWLGAGASACWRSGASRRAARSGCGQGMARAHGARPLRPVRKHKNPLSCTRAHLHARVTRRRGRPPTANPTQSGTLAPPPGWLHPPECWQSAARPGAGRTALALQHRGRGGAGRGGRRRASGAAGLNPQRAG